MSIESVMPSNYLILCQPLLLLPSIFPSIRNFSNESVLRIRWPKDWSFPFSISPSNGYSGLISFIQQHYSKQAKKKKKKWKQPKCPWMDEWINKMWYWEKFTPITLLSSHHHIHFQKLLYPQTVSLCVCVCALVPQLYMTLWDPMDCSPLGSSVLRVFQARENFSFSFSLDDLSLLENPFTIALMGFQKTAKWTQEFSLPSLTLSLYWAFRCFA